MSLLPTLILAVLLASSARVPACGTGSFSANASPAVSGQSPKELRPSGSRGYRQDARATPATLPFRVQPNDELTREGFEKFYNMDYDGAIALFREERKAHPGNPFVVNHLLDAILARELNREGQLDATLYMGNRFLKLKMPPADPRVKAEIEQLSRRAMALADAELARNPRDVNALFARAVARGLAAVYTAVIEKRWLGALREALGAYHDDRRILKLDPNYSDAKLVVGTYQYILGSLSWWEKTIAYVADIHGSKRKGLQLLRAAANGGGEESMDAKTILALFLARDKQYPEAIRIVSGAYAGFPHNFIFGLAQADLLNASGRHDQAIAAYRQLLELGQHGFFPGAHIERVAYALGRALRAKKDYAAAAAAFDQAVNYPGANVSVAAPAALDAGEMYDLLGQRDKALARYRRVIQIAPNTPPARAAARFLQRPTPAVRSNHYSDLQPGRIRDWENKRCGSAARNTERPGTPCGALHLVGLGF